jgi:hypothetical protein
MKSHEPFLALQLRLWVGPPVYDGKGSWDFILPTKTKEKKKKLQL